MLLRFLGFLMLCMGLAAQAQAFHIAGAEFTYECLGGNQYRVKLQFFRDCSQDDSGLPVAGFDDPISLHIFYGQQGSAPTPLYKTVPISAPANTPKVVPPDIEECGGVPPEVCLEEGIYERVITLPPRAGGYDLAWTRCCRNLDVTNLLAPENTGITFLAHVPGPQQNPTAACNSMPEFDQRPPLFLCLNKQLTFDHSATDPDGDSLVYEFSDPFSGLNQQGIGTDRQNPAISSVNNMGPPPYRHVNFAPGYNYTQPFGVQSPTFLNSQTGRLTVTPKNTGLFAFAVSVKEYRNGRLLSVNKRDYQVYVVPCNDLNDLPRITPDLARVDTNTHATSSANEDTIYAEATRQFCYEVTVSDPDPNANMNVSETFPPGVQYTKNTVSGNRVEYDICWTPTCNDTGQTYPLAIKAKDPDDCSYFNFTEDTIWVKIEAPPGPPVQTEADISGNPTVGDTIVAQLFADTACFSFDVTSPNTDTSRMTYTAFVAGGSSQPVQITGQQLINEGVRVTACWPAGCEGVGQPARIIVRGEKANYCPPGDVDYDTVFVRVEEPPNPPPDVSHSYPDSSLDVLNDTLYVFPDSTPCFRFKVQDSLPVSHLRPTVSARVVALDSGQTLTPPTLSNVQVDTTAGGVRVRGQGCWQAPCGYFQDTLAILLEASDSSACRLQHTVYDTLYVRLKEPPNPRPAITRDLSRVDSVRGDTIVSFADSSFCYDFTVRDTLPAGAITLAMRIENASSPPYSGPPAQLFVNQNINDTLLAGELCLQTTCASHDDTLRLILEARDSVQCVESHRVRDTVMLIVRQPENTPPDFRVTYNDSAITDTLQVLGDDSLCLDFAIDDTLADAQFGQHLSLEAAAITAGGDTLAQGPAITQLFEQTDTTLVGELCWQAPCDQINETVRLSLLAVDSSTCTREHEVRRNYRIEVQPRPTDPIQLNITGETIERRGDTLVFHPKQPGCANVSLIDTANIGNLSLAASGAIFQPANSGYEGPAATLSDTSGRIRLDAQLCWQPGCAQKSPGLWPVTLRGVSRPYCTNPITIEKQLWVKVEEPENRPPELSVKGLPSQVATGRQHCFEVFVNDPDSFALLGAQGESEVFAEGYGQGGEVAITRVDTPTSTALRLELCFTPNCYKRQATYDITVGAYDSTRCDTTLFVSQTYNIDIENCALSFPNVFTPNGDGLNEAFGPTDLKGIENYRMWIFDRWGNRLFVTERGERWDGTLANGEPAAEGTYFYRIDFRLHSGTGEPLGTTKTGSVTLVR